jgi:prepilin-type processing-associated H-X9-DG protein
MKNTRTQKSAFTLLELIVVVGLIALLAVSLLPAMARTRPQAQRLACANNLKQVVVSFRTWAANNNGKMPMGVSRSSGGAADSVGMRTLTGGQSNIRGVWGFFQVMSNQLNTPKVLMCPAESESGMRQTATTFAFTIPADGNNSVPFTNDLNCSYAVGVDALEAYPRMMLVADHNLGNGNPPVSGFTMAPSSGTPFVSLGNSFVTNSGVSFLDNTHSLRGNVGMADGSVEFFGRMQLQDALRNSGAPSRTAGVFTLAPGSTGSGLNRIQFP